MNSQKGKAMTDYIKREDALKVFDTDSMIKAWHKTEHIPSADVAPVRHERWKLNRSGRGANCSRCDMWMPFTMLPYCPYCGARMDGESDE